MGRSKNTFSLFAFCTRRPSDLPDLGLEDALNIQDLFEMFQSLLAQFLSFLLFPLHTNVTQSDGRTKTVGSGGEEEECQSGPIVEEKGKSQRKFFFSSGRAKKERERGREQKRFDFPTVSPQSLSPPLAIGISPSPDWLGGGGGSFCLSRSPTTVNPRKESRRVCPRAGRGRKIPSSSSCLLPAQSSPEFVGQCGPQPNRVLPKRRRERKELLPR